MVCNKNCQKKFDEKLNERFVDTDKFSNHDYNKLILFLRKCVYTSEYMDDCKKFNKTSLPEKRRFF